MNNRAASTIIGAIFFFLFHCQTTAQKIALNGSWKYSVTDDKMFSSSGLDDSKWKVKPAEKLVFTSEDLDTKSHYVWVRKAVVIPSSFKDQLQQTGALSLFLGRINQTDETYLNGELLGETTSSDIRRVYVITPNKVRWDQENMIAVRIYHWSDRAGLDAQPYLAAAPASAVFVLRTPEAGVQKKEQVKKGQAVYTCTAVNRSEKAVNSDISAVFYDAAAKKLGTYHKAVLLSQGNNVISFPFTSPSSFLKIQYTLTIPQYNHKAVWNDEFGYNPVAYKPVQPVVADKVAAHFIPADIQRQVITGWLGGRMDANEKKRLYQVDEPALLAGYINRPGSHPWIGEHVGKFLDAASFTYKNTGSATLKTQMDRTAQQLIGAQMEDGYMGTYTPDNYWTSWDVWSHKYNLIGLLNYYAISGYQPALEASKKTGDLLCKTFGYNTGQRDLIAAGTHVGMASTSVLEPMVDLYRYTGDQKYLDFCYYIIKSFDQQNGPKIISTLNATGGRVDKTANAKAYEMMSNLVGIIKLYRITGDDQFLQPVLMAWKDIVAKRLYITGTASSFEHFKDDGILPATDKDNMGEGCVTTTWLQLNFQMLCIFGEIKYLDELERSVYNHLTGAENPVSGCVSYYTPLSGKKPYRCVITCCMSSIPRGISMIPLFANGTINSKPSFLFYQPGTYSTQVAGNTVSFNTTTEFPSDGKISIKVDVSKATQFPVAFRKPYWAEGFSLMVNGEKQAEVTEETVTINRSWKKGDNISVSFTMPLMVLDGGRSYPGHVALQRGPQVLVFDNSLNKLITDTVSVDPATMQLQPASSLLTGWMGADAFQLKTTSGSAEKNIILVPYADASQTGGAITTWIKKEAGK